ncbi:MAG: aminopeptidase [Clostridiales bacterium]|jgi:aminopeptidase|nr:aminopeptidase [Clostridiales bacterium]
MTGEELKKLAKVFVRVGGAVQPGDVVVIACDTQDAPFARIVSEVAYDAGAKNVVYKWDDEECSRMRFLRAKDEVFDESNDWLAEYFKYYDDQDAVYLNIISNDPDFLAGVDPDRIGRGTVSRGKTLVKHRENTMSNKVRWSIVGLPSPRWAAKVFPTLPLNEAVERLGEAILKVSRAQVADPIRAWEEHNNNFKQRVEYLTKKNFKSLKFKNKLGTDLEVRLLPGHQWVGGRESSSGGRGFNPNIPTEEIFTAPYKFGVNGRVVASLPLSLYGNLIEGFEFTFENGKVVDFKAEKNEENLKKLIETDEGSKYLGEVALVPIDSPISREGVLFYETLFDENAACHLALGKGYAINLKDSDGMTKEEIAAVGLNDSLVHIDFMFGTEDMSIIGIEYDGTESDVFVNGLFVF